MKNQAEKQAYEIKTEAPDANLRGTILRGVGGLYTVMTEDGRVLPCSVRGIFRHEKIKPLPGDRVLVTEPEGNSAESDIPRGGDLCSGYVISEILPRKNALIRPPVANLDIIFIVIASALPEPSTLTADKLISIAEFNGIKPVIVISKSDLDSHSASRLYEIYEKCGFDVFGTSSDSGDGTEELREYLLTRCGDEISTFAGVSGAGKSTLLNTLFPSLYLETGELSARIGRGKNTTRTSELFPLREISGGLPMRGFLADTPGFSMLDFKRFDFFSLSDLPETFREFRPYLTSCRYTKCTHTKEEGCAVLSAVSSGIIPAERHESYLSLYADLKDKHAWDR